ncbi:unnamed protein product [Lampetra fluviatilis]
MSLETFGPEKEAPGSEVCGSEDDAWAPPPQPVLIARSGEGTLLKKHRHGTRLPPTVVGLAPTVVELAPPWHSGGTAVAAAASAAASSH